MQAVILAGGQGLRLREIIKDRPKPMAPIAGKPFLEYLVLQLARWDIKEIVLSVGYQAGLIRSHFGDGKRFGTKIRYAEEVVPLGTGGGLREACQLIGDQPFIVMNGDSFLDLDLSALDSFHRTKQAKVSLSLKEMDDTSRYGKVEIDKTGAVIGFTEKERGHRGLINGGVYIFEPAVIEIIPAGRSSLEHDILPLLIGQGLYGSVTDGFFVDIGVPEYYLKLCQDPERLLHGIAKTTKQS